jgi:hypothetical protein
MTTRLYFRNIVSSNAPPTGTRSLVLPDGIDNSLTSADNQSLLLAQGASDVEVSLNTVETDLRQSGKMARFTSEPLAAQIISPVTWELFLRRRQANTQGNVYTALSIYIWRPSSQRVIGYVYDSVAELGQQWTSAFSNDTVNFSGSAVSARGRDVLVCELWYTSQQRPQDSNRSFNNRIAYNNTSYLETPQVLQPYVFKREQVFGTIID